MSGTEWAALGLFAGTVIGLSFLDGDLAVGLVVIVGVVVVVTTIGANKTVGG
jgi:ABC-type transport system involved in cytochrome bd biosynthesis fused ATPase/permease subunit